MKRRTKQNTGQWPNMRDDTLKAISGELIRARKKHPSKMRNLELTVNYLGDLRTAFWDHHNGKSSAAQIYALAATVAALAIRCLEEGAEDYKYAGNVAPPNFELTP